MRKIAVNIYREGSDNLWIDCYRDVDSCIIVGNTKIRDKYRILLTKIDEKGKILWNKTYGGEDEYEGLVILKVEEGYLIGGNAHGTATPIGGKNWQAYLLLVDKNGKKLKERSYKIGENDAVYNIVEENGCFYCLGETSANNKKYVFVMQINRDFDMMNLWKYGGSEDILAGGLTPNFLAYSYKINNRWFGKIIKLNKNEKYWTIWKKELENILIYSIGEYNNHILLVGSKNSNAFLLKMNHSGKIIKERSLGEGTLTNIVGGNRNTIVLGDENGHPAVFLLDENFQILDKFTDADIRGWYENGFMLSENTIIMLCYSSQFHEALMVFAEWS